MSFELLTAKALFVSMLRLTDLEIRQLNRFPVDLQAFQLFFT